MCGFTKVGHVEIKLRMLRSSIINTCNANLQKFCRHGKRNHIRDMDRVSIDGPTQQVNISFTTSLNSLNFCDTYILSATIEVNFIFPMKA